MSRLYLAAAILEWGCNAEGAGPLCPALRVGGQFVWQKWNVSRGAARLSPWNCVYIYIYTCVFQISGGVNNKRGKWEIRQRNYIFFCNRRNLQIACGAILFLFFFFFFLKKKLTSLKFTRRKEETRIVAAWIIFLGLFRVFFIFCRILI